MPPVNFLPAFYPNRGVCPPCGVAATKPATPRFAASLPPQYPVSETSNRLLSRADRRREKQQKQKHSAWHWWLTVPLLSLGLVAPPVVQAGVQFAQDKVTQIQGEYKQAGPVDGPMLQAGAEAHALLLIAGVADNTPLAGRMLRKVAKDHRQEWLDKMPPDSRQAVQPIMDAFIRGASADELAKLISAQATFSLAGPSRLSDIHENDSQTPANRIALKKLMQTQGTDDFIVSGANRTHFWHVPAAAGKPTILYSNGRGADMVSTTNFILEAHKQGYGIMLYEYPNNGDSTGTLSQEGYYRSAEMALNHLRGLGIQPHNIINVGYSMGTNIAAWLGKQYPDIGKLVMISPPEGLSKVYADIKDHYKNTLASQMAISADLLDTFNTTSLLEGANGIKNKTMLFFYGKNDTYVLPQQTKTLAEKAKGNNHVVLTGIEDQTHSSIRDNPDSVARIFEVMQQTLPA